MRKILVLINQRSTIKEGTSLNETHKNSLKANFQKVKVSSKFQRYCFD